MKTVFDSKTILTALAQIIVAIAMVIQSENKEIDGTGYALIVKSLWDMYLRFNTSQKLKTPDLFKNLR